MTLSLAPSHAYETLSVCANVASLRVVCSNANSRSCTTDGSKLLKKLIAKGQLKAEGRKKFPTLGRDVDGCAGQYWSTKAFMRAQTLARDRRVIIKRRRSRPGHMASERSMGRTQFARSTGAC